MCEQYLTGAHLHRCRRFLTTIRSDYLVSSAHFFFVSPLTIKSTTRSFWFCIFFFAVLVRREWRCRLIAATRIEYTECDAIPSGSECVAMERGARPAPRTRKYIIHSAFEIDSLRPADASAFETLAYTQHTREHSAQHFSARSTVTEYRTVKLSYPMPFSDTTMNALPVCQPFFSARTAAIYSF